MKTIDVDQGWDRIMGDLKKISKTDLTVGFHDDGTMSADGELTMAELAMLQDGGNGIGVPERPFMDKTAINYEGATGDVMTEGIIDLIAGKAKPKGVMNNIGEFYGDSLEQVIEDFDNPSNAQATIDKKGFDNPLIETGKMANSITHRVGGEVMG